MALGDQRLTIEIGSAEGIEVICTGKSCSNDETMVLWPKSLTTDSPVMPRQSVLSLSIKSTQLEPRFTFNFQQNHAQANQGLFRLAYSRPG